MNIQPKYVTFEQAKLLKEKGANNWDEFLKLVNIPEQWQVVEWLRINHGIWISVDVDKNKKDRIYFYILTKSNNQSWSEDKFNTPQEAYSASFDYVLKELI